MGAWSRPAAWLAQGSAVHTVAEVYEKRKLQLDPLTVDDAKQLFSEEYSKEIEKYTVDTPNFEYWFRSGPYGGEVDVERRHGIGLEQVERFIRYTEQHTEEVIWIAPDGTPGIEIGFDFDLDGVLVRGYIDTVEWVDGVLQVVDYKTGNKVPDDDFQLGVYGVALHHMYGVTPQRGTYWMAKTGKHTFPYDLTEWTRERVSERFRELEENIQAERFEPDPEPSKCLFCSVSYSCAYSAA